MRRIVLLLVSIFPLITSCASCTKTEAVTDVKSKSNNTDAKGSKIKIIIGTKTFMATLDNNVSSKAFQEMLPLTVDMIELNNNEKYVDLPNSLPTNASKPGSIQSDDLMLYGNSTLVLFYKSFSTSYSYTRLGRVDDANGLVEALGSGNVKVTYEQN